MMASASAAASPIKTFRPITIFWPREKLAWESVDMLFPPAAFEDSQRQKQKKKCEAQVEDDRPGVHHAPRKVFHVFNQGQVHEELRLPAALGGKCVRKKAQQEQ